mgnify:CR=1 FL=1
MNKELLREKYKLIRKSITEKKLKIILFIIK